MSTGAALLRLGTRLYRLQGEALDSLSTPLSLRQYRILERVDAGVTSPGELAVLARRKPPTISRSVESLVRQAMLSRRPSSVDRRAVSLSLTEPGLDVLAEARATLQNLNERLGTMMGLDIPEIVDRCDVFYAKTEAFLRSDGDGHLAADHTTTASPSFGPGMRPSPPRSPPSSTICSALAWP